MKKLGIILDSFSCIDKKTADEYEIGFLPLQSIIDNKTYLDGVDISYEELINQIEGAKEIRTSLPILSHIEETIESMSKKYEHVIYLGINENLSSSTTTASAIAKNYPNLHIVQNNFCGKMFLDIALYIQNFYEVNNDINLTLKELDKYIKQTTIFITPFSSEYLVRGGRMKGLKKFLISGLQKLRIFPIVKYEGKVSFAGLATSKQHSINKIIQKILLFIGGKENIDKYDFRLIHGTDETNNNIAREIAQKNNINFTSEDFSSGIIAIHTGPRALAIGVSLKINK
ncbi:MAG: DegV family protein [Metamycoplasmataceae bacterium]